MADYLHGHVQSKLLALSMSLSTCQKLLARDPAHAYHLLERIQIELQRVQDEDLRQVSRELYPAIIKMGLVPAMRSLISRFSDLLDIDLIIDTDIFTLDAAGEANLPEIAEEALNNVLKHAKAAHVEVNLLCDSSNRLVLSVSDDGRGFDPVAVDNSQGLVMMSDYAEAIGGKAHTAEVAQSRCGGHRRYYAGLTLKRIQVIPLLLSGSSRGHCCPSSDSGLDLQTPTSVPLPVAFF
jgi:signal transduction histidine kinase